MKKFPLIITLLSAGGALAMAEVPTHGRIYIGVVKDAPAWVWQVPKAGADTNQIAVNAAWARRVETACAQQRADTQNARQTAGLAHADCRQGSGNRMLKPEAGGPQLTSERGIILDYNRSTLSGVISGDDGKRWPFRAAEWAELKDEPERGLWVDFVPEAETGYALFVYSLGPVRVKHLAFQSRR